MAVKMRPTYCRTKRPRGALLQLGIGMYFGIVERRRELARSTRLRKFQVPSTLPTGRQANLKLVFGCLALRASDHETPLFSGCIPNPPRLETSGGTVPGGQFDWGSPLLKSNARVQRSAYPVWKSGWTCKGSSRLDCEAY
jgi:hypothetical protein